MQVDYGKSQPADDKVSLKGAWSRHVTHFKVVVPLKYLWNGLNNKLQILYTGWPCEVLACGLTNRLSGRCGHGHVTRSRDLFKF